MSNSVHTTPAEGASHRTFLNVGCGPKDSPFLPPWLQTPDWREVRLDIDPAVEPDLVGTATDMRGVADRSFDAVWAANIVEHLFAHEVPVALREFARVITPDGIVQILVPNLQRAAALIAAGKLEDTAYVAPAGPIAAIDIVFGYRPAIAAGRIHMAHKTGFVASTLERAVRLAGLAHVAVYFIDWDLLALASHEPLETVSMPPLLRNLCSQGQSAAAPGRSG